jgi:CHAP domain
VPPSRLARSPASLLAPLLRGAALVTSLALAGCAGGRTGGSLRFSCVPYARAMSGIRLHGAAAAWWEEAAGRYRRSHHPTDGSVIVFRATARLPEGHVAVVADVRGPREILVDDANWVRHRITRAQPVIDISPDNDWSLVRVYWPPAHQMGITDYPVAGFIHPPGARTQPAVTAPAAENRAAPTGKG